MHINYTTLLIILFAASTLFFAYVYFRLKLDQRLNRMHDYMGRETADLHQEMCRLGNKINVMEEFINMNSTPAYYNPTKPLQNHVD
jgi:hypothetical protein